MTYLAPGPPGGINNRRLIFDIVSVSVTPLEIPEDWERNCKVVIICNRPGPMWGNDLDCDLFAGPGMACSFLDLADTDVDIM